MLGVIPGAVWAPQEAQVDSRALGRRWPLPLSAPGAGWRPGRKSRPWTRLWQATAAGRHGEADAIIPGGWSMEWWSCLMPRFGDAGQGQDDCGWRHRPALRCREPVIWGNGVDLVPRGDKLLVGATVEEAEGL